MQLIKLESSEKHTFTVRIEITEYFGKVKEILNDEAFEFGNEIVVPLPKVSTDMMCFALEWAERHLYRDFEKSIDEWEADFVRVDADLLQELNETARYLDIKDLEIITAQAIQKMMGMNRPYPEVKIN